MRFAFFDDYCHERGHHPDLLMGLGTAAGAPVYCPPSYLEGRSADRRRVEHVPVTGSRQGLASVTRRNLEASLADASARGCEVFVNLFFDENWDSLPVAPGPLRVIHALHRPAELTGELGGVNAEKTGDVRGLLKQLGEGRDLFVVHTVTGERQALDWLPRDVVVRVGWPAATAAEVRERFAAPRRVTDEEPYVLLVGEALDYKGFHHLLEAVNPGPRLRIAGNLANGEELIARRYPRARVDWEPGWITRERMHRLIEGAAVVAFPYLDEFAAHGGVSAALVQALTFGKAIVVSEPLAPQVPVSEAIMTVPTGDVRALRAAIARGMDHRAVLEDAAQDLREYVLREHTYEGHLEQMSQAVAGR
ncbi:glycosyltransferase [Streptomyces sp. BE147]|uniref:glycosyltransferase n=1 Tax=Streptomyces sp. BE147 TaxID=3002524 RepID=UPI002E7994A9|nr:glycosyltransferase [Streptomyces sp. BE147]MEE1736683.1 glycosyltransferase [Streptomyces sp. BE147]